MLVKDPMVVVTSKCPQFWLKPHQRIGAPTTFKNRSERVGIGVVSRIHRDGDDRNIETNASESRYRLTVAQLEKNRFFHFF